MVKLLYSPATRYYGNVCHSISELLCPVVVLQCIALSSSCIVTRALSSSTVVDKFLKRGDGMIGVLLLYQSLLLHS